MNAERDTKNPFAKAHQASTFDNIRTTNCFQAPEPLGFAKENAWSRPALSQFLLCHVMPDILASKRSSL